MVKLYVILTKFKASPELQVNILQRAQSAYFLSIVICQLFNVFIVKHRYAYSVGWDLFKNKRTFLGIFIGLCIASIVVFVPGIQDILNSAPPPALALLSPVGAGIFLFLYDSLLKFLKSRGYFGGMPKRNDNLLDLVRTTSTI